MNQGLFEIQSKLGYVSGKQFLWIVCAMVIIFFIMVLDIKIYYSLSYLIYGLIMFSFVAVLTIGKEINGAKSWFDFGQNHDMHLFV